MCDSSRDTFTWEERQFKREARLPLMSWASKYTQRKHATTTNVSSWNWRRIAGVFHHLSQFGWLCGNTSRPDQKVEDVLAVSCLSLTANERAPHHRLKPLGGVFSRLWPALCVSHGVKMQFCTFTPKTWINGTLVGTLGGKRNLPTGIFFFPLTFYHEMPTSRC